MAKEHDPRFAEADDQKRLADEAKQRAESQIRADEKAAKEREKAAGDAEKFQKELAESQRKHEELARKVAELEQTRNQPARKIPELVLQSTALDPVKAQEKLRRIWPATGRRRAAVLRQGEPIGKTFLVTPVGRHSANRKAAVVTNCADECDAKARYFKDEPAAAYQIATRVEPYGETKERLEQRQREFDAAQAASFDQRVARLGPSAPMAASTVAAPAKRGRGGRKAKAAKAPRATKAPRAPKAPKK